MKKIIALDSSQLNQYMKCPLSWAYAYRENLMLTGAARDALDRGSIMHLYLDAFYKIKDYHQSDMNNRLSAANSICFKVRETALREFPDMAEGLPFIEKRFIEYVTYYTNRDLTPLVNAGVTACELGFSKPLYEDDEYLFLVEGKIDLLHIDQNSKEMIVVDHKTQSRVNNLYDYRPQVLTYCWAAKCNYFMYNYVGLQEDKNGALLKNDNLFRRSVISVPDWMLTRWENHMLEIFWEITSVETMKDTNIHKNLGSCAGAFDSSPCQFHYLCETKDDNMRQHLKAFKYEVRPTWEPWKLTENKLTENTITEIK